MSEDAHELPWGMAFADEPAAEVDRRIMQHGWLEGDPVATAKSYFAAMGSPEVMGDRVLLIAKPQADEKIGSLYTPDTAKEVPTEGLVIATGPGVWVDGQGDEEQGGEIFRATPFNPGDVVLYAKYSATPVRLGDTDALVVRAGDILLRLSQP